MKARTTVWTLLACFALVALSFADSPQMGTWKLNEAKSKLGAGMPKNTTVTYEAAGDNVRVTVDGVDGQGNPAHNEWTGKFDGKDYPITGDPTAEARSYKTIDDRTLQLANKKDGKVVMSGKVVISADGKTRTVTISGIDPSGKRVHSTSVYDKQ
jgi:hypothetical protein